jgi:hypothetical protein
VSSLSQNNSIVTGASSPQQLAMATPTLSHLAMWPSMLDKLLTTAEPLARTNDHLMEEYKLARGQAGLGQGAAVEIALGATRDAAGQLRYRAVQQSADATDGAASSQKGAATAQAGDGKHKQLQGRGSTINDSVAKLGGTKVDKPKPKAGNLLDQARSFVYDHTLGKVVDLTGSLQGWITRTVGTWAFARAGLTKDELDMAGIDDSMRADELEDHKTEADMKQAQADAAKVDPAVAKLLANASADEQVAIQAMVDTQEFMTAIDDARAALAHTIADGDKYIEQVTPIIRRARHVDRALGHAPGHRGPRRQFPQRWGLAARCYKGLK